MLTHQLRERVFRVDSDIEFPNEIELNIYFRPDTAFGNSDAPGRTWKRSTPGSVMFNANTGDFSINPENTLNPLDVVIENSNMTFSLNGNHLVISTYCESNSKLTELIDSLYYVFPYVLSLGFHDPVTVDRVDGRVGKVDFRWEIKSFDVPILISDQESQENNVAKSWELMALLSSTGNRRVVAALKYYYTACRLRRVGNSPWEFSGEIIINLCKSLEALFPSTRDSVHDGLKNIGYSSSEIY